MPSFDVVSEPPLHEIDNAVQQASRELAQRYDFRGTETSIDKTEEGLVLRSSSEGRLQAAYDVLQQKLVKRAVSLKVLDPEPLEPAAKGHVRRRIKLRRGVSAEKGKEMVKALKASKLRVQTAIQSDQLRVTGKKKDELQEAIRLLKETEFGIALQFTNFRD
ncbi:MAG: YajQ family cyclic di-GMP-binding protein [Proteobacteria bacterium]|nr:YajQ family cyclic di-GMP-binding protein [Pseudomonadota bacterium]